MKIRAKGVENSISITNKKSPVKKLFSEKWQNNLDFSEIYGKIIYRLRDFFERK